MAGGNTNLADFNGKFRALISTSAVDAKTNTATTGTGVSIHWLGGQKVADDYADLYDGDWDSVSGKTEGGSGYTGLVWTGGNKAGQKSGQRYAGASEVRLGDLSDATMPLSSPNAGASSETHPIYALSPVLTVAEPQPSNHEPQFASDTAERSVNEDAAVGAGVGDPVVATDADSDALTYTIAGSDAFTINASTGQIAVASALDYETTASYTLTVSVRDGKDAAGETDTVVDDTIAVTVNVGNVDEAGTVSLSMDADPPQVGSTLTASLLDPDGGVTNETWSWARSTDQATWETIDGTTRAAYTASEDDEGRYLRATASYTDGHGPGKTAENATANTVTAASTTPQTEPAITAGPAITSSPATGDSYGKDEAIEVSMTFSEAVTVTGGPKVRLVVGERKRWAHYSRAENGGTTLVFAYSVKAEDRDDNGVSLPRKAIRLNGGTIEDADGNSASLRSPALSDQSGHKVDGSRKASDDSQSSQQQQQSPPANSPPVFAGNSAALSVNEDAAVGANMGSPLTASDADNDTLTYAIAGSDAFTINASTGQITVAGALDYERQASYNLTVSVSDGKNADGEVDPSVDVSISVTVSVVNVDEPGRVILPAAPRAGTPVKAGILDPDGDPIGVSWSWGRSADQVAWATIDGATGAAYTPSNDDVGYYLRAAASYTDPQGPGKTASTATPNPVKGIGDNQGNTPSQPTGLSATSGDRQVTLRWDDQSSETNITKWQYRYVLERDGGNRPPTAWKDIPNSDRNTTSYTVTGLTNWRVYQFDIRAVAGSLMGPKPDRVDGRPAPAVTPGEQTVARDWTYKPAGLQPGDKFRLIFVTDSTTAATETGIAYYNTFVQTAAANNANLVNNVGNSFSSHFRALATTGAAHAIENTHTTSRPGVPIYWLGGEKVSDGYGGLYDGGWDSYAGKTESGKSYTGNVWTGTQDNGYKDPSGLTGYMGHSSRGIPEADLSKPDPFRDGTEPMGTNLRPLYALSPVLVVKPAPLGVQPGDFDATPGDRHVVLNWVVRWYDESRAKWQFRYRAEDATSYGAWTDVPNCDMRYCWSHRVSGLTNGTAYTFQVRALAQDGDPSPASEEQTATPRALVAPVAQRVPADWALIPDGLGPGDRFRLLFITTGRVDATSTEILDYDRLVRDEAIKSGEDPNSRGVQGNMVSESGYSFSTEFRALVSTATVDARINTATTGTGVPIYWLDGERAADNYNDFYDGDWEGQPTDRDGKQVTSAYNRYARAWTGSNDNGTKDSTLFMGSPVGNVHYGAMHLNRGGSPWQGVSKKEERLRLFAISPVLTVAPAK